MEDPSNQPDFETDGLAIGQPAIRSVAETLEADIFLYTGGLSRAGASKFIEMVQSKNTTKESAYLVLATGGGDPDAAFKIAEALRLVYKNVVLAVFGMCKSAGTLIALGADAIVMEPLRAEFGPLDVQIRKEDEFTQSSSGLDIFHALDVVSERSFSIFEEHLLKLKRRSGGSITTQTGADIATTVSTELLKPITSQIDPYRLGEMRKSLQIAHRYGVRLGAEQETLDRLINHYPSHSFVIGFNEAQALFGNVRQPDVVEVLLARTMQVKMEEETGQEGILVPYQPEDPGQPSACVFQFAPTNQSPQHNEEDGFPSQQRQTSGQHGQPPSGGNGQANDTHQNQREPENVSGQEEPNPSDDGNGQEEE